SIGKIPLHLSNSTEKGGPYQMIKVISPKAGDEFVSMRISELGVPILIGPLSSFNSTHTNPPVDLGFLDQGPIVDEFGNKFVNHVDLDGELVMIGTDMSYELVKPWPLASLTGRGISITGYKRSYPSTKSTYSGALIVDGSFGSAVLGGTEDTKEHGGWSGYSNWALSWSSHGYVIDIEVSGEGYYLDPKGKTWVKSRRHSRTRITLDIAHSCAYLLESNPGDYTTYSDGRVSQVEEIPGARACTKPLDWLAYQGASPALSSILGINPAFTMTLNDTFNKYVQESNVWPELCQKAILSAQYVDCNMIAMINDLRNLRVDLTSVLEGFKRIPKINLKTKAGWKEASSQYLGNKYGYQLTISDAGAIGEALERLRQNCKAGMTDTKKLLSASSVTLPGRVPLSAEFHYTAKVGSSNDPLLAGIKGLYDWDLYPSLGNMWDLIPYSFVADWVVGIGDLLEDIDANVYMRYYQAKSIMKSTKITTGPVDNQQILGSLPGACGLVSYTHYRRWVEFAFEPMPLSVDFHPENLLGHWVEGASLIIQRI
ncbi:TPA_asm: maturation protein, partial [ssRNA phage SRR7976300_1]